MQMSRILVQSIGTEKEKGCRTGSPGYTGGIDPFESIPGLLKSLKIPAAGGIEQEVFDGLI
jgi:hypothetical protein